MFKRNTCLKLILFVAVLSGGGCRRQETTQRQNDTLKADKRVEMVTERDGVLKPIFRAAVRLKKTDGSDADNVKFDKPDELKKKIEIKTPSGKRANVFYAAVGIDEGVGSSQNAVSHDILLLFDVSGSMNYKDIQPDRFTVAKDAAEGLVRGLGDNYRVAVVPFESRQVKAKFDNAQFLSPQQAANGIRQLHQPDNKGNTALYSAMDFALDVLNNRKSESQDQSLIVLTDGKNDVGHSGDDQRLLGDEGFDLVLRKIEKSNLRTFTIGLGKPNTGGQGDLAFEEDKLRKLASTYGEGRYFQANNLEDLKAGFNKVQTAVKNILNISFCTDDKNYHDLRSLNFNITYTSPDGKTYRGLVPWICRNSITGCVPERSGTLKPGSPEYENCEKNGCGGVAANGWSPVWWLFGQLTLLSGGIALLWMFVPSLIWPTIPLPSLPSRGRQKDQAIPSKKTPRSSPLPDRATPSKPRQRFEETKIYDNTGRRNDQ